MVEEEEVEEAEEHVFYDIECLFGEYNTRWRPEYQSEPDWQWWWKQRIAYFKF
jgi:hypothetical protein